MCGVPKAEKLKDRYGMALEYAFFRLHSWKPPEYSTISSPESEWLFLVMLLELLNSMKEIRNMNLTGISNDSGAACFVRDPESILQSSCWCTLSVFKYCRSSSDIALLGVQFVSWSKQFRPFIMYRLYCHGNESLPRHTVGYNSNCKVPLWSTGSRWVFAQFQNPSQIVMQFWDDYSRGLPLPSGENTWHCQPSMETKHAIQHLAWCHHLHPPNFTI